MKTTTRIFLIGCSLMLCSISTLCAQESNTSDLGLWTSIEGATKLGPCVGLSFEAEYRMRDDISATDRTSIGANLSYKNKTALPWLKADIGYAFIYKNNPAETNIKYRSDGVTPKHKNIDASYWGAKHRATASLSGSWKVGRAKIGLRERYQYTYTAPATCERTRLYYNEWYEAFKETIEDLEEWYLIDDPTDEDYSYLTDTKNARSDHKLRSRCNISYNIRHCKFEPFAEIELYNDLDNRCAIDKVRYTLGTDYKLSKTSRLTVFYRFQDHADDDEMGGHVIGLGYAFDF